MELFGKTLDTETQLLIAIGSAVAAGCQPFLTVLNFPRPYIPATAKPAGRSPGLRPR